MYIEASQVIFQKYNYTSLSEDSADPDDRTHYAIFHLCIHYLPKGAFMRH